MKRATEKVIPDEPGPGKRRPDRHSFRRTCASAVAQSAMVWAILGHRPSNVTDLCVSIPVEGQIVALSRATLLIDGEPQKNVLPLTVPTKMSGEMSGAAEAARAR